MNIVVPMAGAGSRFKDVGFKDPKPFIVVKGKPMIQWALEGLGLDGKVYMFYSNKLITDGAVKSVLMLEKVIDTQESLFIVNCDQYVDWDRNSFFEFMKDADGGILTFKAKDPKWSFVKTDTSGIITEVAEKEPISNDATVGIYYWKHGCDFVYYAKQMIYDDFRVNGEYYICPVYNWAIKDGKKIKVFPVDKMQGLGTPEDIKNFI